MHVREFRSKTTATTTTTQQQQQQQQRRQQKNIINYTTWFYSSIELGARGYRFTMFDIVLMTLFHILILQLVLK